MLNYLRLYNLAVKHGVFVMTEWIDGRMDLPVY